MSDEPVLIEATHGPYAGQRLSVSADEAKQALAEGWARDPFAPADEAPKELLPEEERLKIVDAATKAGRRLRGEDRGEADDKPKKGEPKARDEAKEERALEADKPTGTYQTRTSKPK